MRKSAISTGLLFFAALSANVAMAAISPVPLFLSTSADPNVLINMSVESPMGGAAYNDQAGTLSGGAVCAGRGSVGGEVGTCYFTTETYLGYFDPKKCYQYDSTNNYFEPTGAAESNHSCVAANSGGGEFSGNFMNWASMTAIDMFVWTMTGGNRVVDTTSETVIKRMRKQDSDSWFPPKYLSSGTNVAPSTVTPYSESAIHIYNTDFGIQFGTSRKGSEKDTFDLKIKVCDSGVGLETNCQVYGSYYKPEGLMQTKADSMRFAVTSYSNDNDKARDGGVLRANMKYIGALKPDGSGGTTTNAEAEITVGGLLVNNPNPSDATASGVANSGVINYLNKFSDSAYKSSDPASELFYESLRYFKNLGRTPEYADGLATAALGGFPAITTWDDPIQYRCQKNFILGINDANPWLDKKLPGTHFTSATFNGHSLTDGDYGEPSNPDTDINVTTLTNQVGSLEGLNGTSQCIGCTGLTCNSGPLGGADATSKTIPGLGEVMGTCPAPQKENSYYISGLAYYANTTDIRSDFTGEQNVASFFIDTQEYSATPLTGPMNMLWLAGKYGGFVDSNGNDQPDLTSEWDADGDSEPDSYVLASRPDKLIKALTKNFGEIQKRSSSAASVTTSSTRLDTSTHVFQAKFNSGDWSGELSSVPLTASGTLGASAWEASSVMPAHGSRNIVTWDGPNGGGIAFTTANVALINGTASAALSSLSADQISYLRGDTSGEQQNGGGFRNRSSVLGDIINSDPVFVSNQNFGYDRLGGTVADAYVAFRAGLSRSSVVYVGGNDGMLHGFNGATGVELFSYIPKAVYGNLADLSEPAYSHQYYVDGSPTVGDAYVDLTTNANVSTWSTVLVGTTGAGGKGVFALDVTDPDSFVPADVIWDIDNNTATIFNDLGHTLGKASIARMANDKFYAVFGNGYGSSGGKAVLYLVLLDDDLDPTDTTHVIKLEAEILGGNGMSAPLVVDTDGDRTADAIYAGDLKGNLWKVDVTSTDPTEWYFTFNDGATPPANPEPLFIAEDASSVRQPITAMPEVGANPLGGLVVLFGTGKYFETGDSSVGVSPAVQSFYGLWDQGAQIPSRTVDSVALQVQTIQAELLAGVAPNLFDVDIRVTSDSAVNPATQKGWYMDLVPPAGAAGERVVNKAILRGDRVIFTTVIPSSDPCSFGGSSWLMEVSAANGSRLALTPFDLNGDNVFNDSDKVTVTIAGVDVLVAVSGKRVPDLGIIKTPGIVDAGTKELKVVGGTSGNMDVTTESKAVASGRQAWQQLR